MSSLTLYRHPLSGHCHRVQLFLHLLDLAHELVDLDLQNAAHKQPDFLAMSPFGQIPVLQDGEHVLYDSNAILVYLALRYDPSRHWLPAAPLAAAAVQRNLSLAAGQIAYGPCAARLVTVFGADLNQAEAIDRAHIVLKVLDVQLTDQDWLATDHATIADVANYAYIAHAPEGGVSLEHYSGVRAWLRRVEELPGFVPMQSTRVSLAA